MTADSTKPYSALTAFVINRNSVAPLHRQVEHWLRQQIESGALGPGAKLPPRKDFSELLGGLNHLTISKAVASLAREGLIFSIAGRGTFVADRRGKQLRVAIILPNMEDEFTREIAAGIQAFFNQKSETEDGESRRGRVATVVLDSWRDAEKEEENIEHLEDLPVDGAIILPLAYGDIVGKLAHLHAQRFPIVLVDQSFPGIKISSVRSDNYGGAYELTKHLIQAGSEGIGWIGAMNWFNSAKERYEGFRDAICDAGIPFDRTLTFNLVTPSPTAPFAEAMKEVVDKIVRIPKIKSIFCDSGAAALLCMELLKKSGVRIPEDMTVVGFDDCLEARFSQPPLTVIRQPVREIGSRAAQLLLQYIDKPDAPAEEIILPVTLIVRESSRANNSK